MSRILLKELLRPYGNRNLDSIEKYEAITGKLKFTTEEERIRLLAECEDRISDRESGAPKTLELLLSFLGGACAADPDSGPERIILLMLLIVLLTVLSLERIYESRYFYLKTILENYRDPVPGTFPEQSEYRGDPGKNRGGKARTENKN